MNRYQTLYLVTFAVGSLFHLSACVAVHESAVVIPERRDHTVTVVSGSKTLENPEQRLIDRIELSSSTLPGDANELPFRFLLVSDREGRGIGLKLRAKSGSIESNALKLKKDDVLKAVNKTEVASPKQVDELLRAIKDEGSGSVVFERGGQIHKYFYSLRDSREGQSAS